MINFERYPHIHDLINYYTNSLKRKDIAKILQTGLKNAKDAELLSRFIWQMLDRMSEDANKKITVIGQTDNSNMIPDLEYEITLHIDEKGFRSVWDRVSDEENP